MTLCTYFGGKLDYAFEHVLAIDVTIVVGIQIDHEARVPRNLSERLEEELPCVTTSRGDQKSRR